MTIKSWKWWLSATLALGLFALLALIVPNGLRAAANGTNLVANPGFEEGVKSWTCKSCILTATTPAHSGAKAGQLRTTSRSARAQLFQSGRALTPGTEYELSFWAKSNGGQDLQVDLYKASNAATNYGLNQTFDLTTEWQAFTVTFTTGGFSAPVSDGRLRFRAPQGLGLRFSLDDVSLLALSEPPPPPPPGSEALVFDWNKAITTAEHGFPWDKPPLANGDWTTPVNYAQGTFYLRAEIFSIPANQDDMKLQFCIWQYSNRLENCTRTVDVPGRAGTVVEWSVPVQNLWKKDGAIIDWKNPRDRNGFAIKNGQVDPVSDYSGWHWNGERPGDWYPMNARLTVVVVEKGGTFSGWDHYIP